MAHQLDIKYGHALVPYNENLAGHAIPGETGKDARVYRDRNQAHKLANKIHELMGGQHYVAPYKTR